MGVKVGVTLGVKLGRGVAVDLGVDTAVRDKVAVGVGTAADLPRAAQPAAASRQSSSPAKHQTRCIRGETGETDMRGRLCVQVRG